MTGTPSNIARQKRSGYVLLAGAVLITAGGVVAVTAFDVPPIAFLGVLVPVGILAFFGLRAVSAGREGVAIQDERSADIFQRAGLNAFWWLMSVILLVSWLAPFGDTDPSAVYVMAGLVIFAAYVVYYRFLEGRWTTN